jgi:hypothetical protein
VVRVNSGSRYSPFDFGMNHRITFGGIAALHTMKGEDPISEVGRWTAI